MSTDYVKRYYGKVNTRITQVNEKDPFSTSFISAIGAGDNTLFQKYMIETRVFDGTWVDFLEASISSLDNIVRNPKSFIKDQSEIVPIEMAKKTSAASVRHLASHSRYVKTISERGEVIPEKILTVFREEDLAIYENRFVKTLIDKLVLFVEKRYATIVRLIGSDFINKFNQTSKFEYDNVKVDFEMRMTCEKKVTDSEAELRNQEILKRIEEVRAAILGFANSPFMRNLKSARPVQAPIQKTNILTKDPSYRKCYELWLFLDSYGKIDYTVETGISEQKASEEYQERIKELILLSFATVVGNDESEMGRFATLPAVNKKAKKTKVISDPDIASEEKSLVMENHLINEYYYQEARRLYSRRINEAVVDGEPYHVALKDVYQKAFQITESIFNSLMEIPDDVKNDPIALLRFRMRNQQALDQILKYKTQDIKKMEKAKTSNLKQIDKMKAKLQKKTAPVRPKVKSLPPEEEQVLKDQEKEKLLQVKSKELDKAKLLKQRAKEREKERLLAQKAKEREKAKLLKQKEREKELLTLKRQKEKEKEKARLLAQREKEKEMMKGLSKEEREKLKARLEAKRLRELEKKKAQATTALTTPIDTSIDTSIEGLEITPAPAPQDVVPTETAEVKEARVKATQTTKAKLLAEKEKVRKKPISTKKTEAQKAREKAKALKEKEKEKEKARLQIEREKEKEKAKLEAQKAKDKEKAKLEAQKAKEKEKAKLEAQREKEKEKARLAAEREKEQERLKKQKAKEREKAKLLAQKAKSKKTSSSSKASGSEDA